MSVFSGVGGGGWGLLAGCIIPAAIASSIIAFGVLPYISIAPVEEFEALKPAETALVLSGVAIAIGFVINALQTPLYRLLEGYSLPRWAREPGKRRQAKRRDAVADAHQAADPGISRALALERSRGFPSRDRDLAPTRLGNALRAFEVYAYERYRLDSQTLWYELEALAPPALRTELERARMPVDFCVSCVYLACVVGTALVAVAIGQDEDRVLLAVGGVLALAASPGFYLLGVASTGHWSGQVQALVNLVRPQLAAAMGLRLPATMREERALWLSLSLFARGEHKPDDIARLDRYRATPAVPEPVPGSEGAQFLLQARDGGRVAELQLADGRVLATGPLRASREDALSDVSLIRSVAVRAIVAEEPAPTSRPRAAEAEDSEPDG
jgi:hypothetical protein